jgi:D-sedoheptulose 7-phosphate isomerase
LEVICEHCLAAAIVYQTVPAVCGPSILEAANRIADAFRAQGKLLLCGNGGSAADCQHFAAEFTSRLSKEFERPALPALALTTDTSFLTAFANDYNFEGVFARQVEALGQPGDILFGISTSGNSPNVVAAVEAARRRALQTIVLIGQGGRLRDLADLAITVPSDHPQHIQEAHLAIEHLLCHLVERAMFDGQDMIASVDGARKNLGTNADRQRLTQ